MRLADAGDAVLPAFVAAQDLDLDAEKTDGDVAPGDPGKTNGVFLGGNNHLEITADAASDEAVELGFRVAVMIGVTFGELDARAQFSEAVFEALRRGDAANGADVGVAKPVERDLFAGQDILEMERFVSALDDLGGPIVEPDPFDQLVVRLARALGDEDVAGAPQIPGRLA